VIEVDLYRALDVSRPQSHETLLARADGRVGRGPGRFVAFAVDRADRLVKAPLEDLAPLPSIVREQIRVDFFAGVVRLPAPDDTMAFLLDPAKAADSAPQAKEV
jgi:hypothetical protein